MPPPANKRARTGVIAANDSVRRIALHGGFSFPPELVSRWRESEFCDVTVRVEDSTFEAHRIVLAQGSDYFSSLFRQTTFRDSGGETDLSEIRADVFEIVLEFLYSGTAELAETELCLVLEAATRLQISALILAATVEVKNHITASTCCDIWDLADKLSLKELEEAAKMEAIYNFGEVAQSDVFLTMPPRRLKALLSSDMLLIESEDALYDAVMNRWLEAQKPKPAMETLLDLLRLVRFPLMKREFVDATLQGAKAKNAHQICELIYESFMDCCYNGMLTRSAWQVPVRVPNRDKQVADVKGNELTFATPGIVPLNTLLSEDSGTWDVSIKLLEDEESLFGAASGFGFIDSHALTRYKEAVCNADYTFDLYRAQQIPGLWWLRRYQGIVYSENEREGNCREDDDNFSFPVGARIRMRIDTDTCEATFFVDERQLAFKARGIKMPVRPFVLCYDEEGGVKIRLMSISRACIAA